MQGFAPLTDDRLWTAGDSRPVPGREFVLYWMQVTQRAHDNFALNFAIERADELGLPVLVYHGIRHDYPWASDRFHTFILEGVTDLTRDFAQRGIQYACYLDTRSPDDKTGPTSPLIALAHRAAMVVTDWFPTFIFPRQTRALRDKVDCPVVAVDSATIIPAKRLGKAFSSARHIRPALMKDLEDWLLPPENPEPERREQIALPFTPTVPTRETIPALVASCAIDHSVPPALGWTGGSVAARTRLDWWVPNGLPRYLERNDPNLDVTSKMSPWLHFGHVSVHEVLLAAKAAGPGEQWEKFLDETLTWRELAFNLCTHEPKHRTLSAVPEWARNELSNHGDDTRTSLYDDATLEAAATGDALWNACQRAYLRDGWMHNYLRMLWGKSVIGWTESPVHALQILEHLNNKYALDGRDPNSYGGILWCFGKFDRPFYRRPVFGTVRYMSLKAAATKFDVKRYIASQA
jgi:photolyase PhrII